MIKRLIAFRLTVSRFIGLSLIATACCLLATIFSSLLSTSVLAEVSLAQPQASSLRSEAIQPIPLKIELDNQKVRLGKSLFQEKQLSGNKQISCASCHNLSLSGADQIPKSIGADIGFVNAPTVLNSAFNIKQFWDGRADSLEEQIDGPMTSSHEMNSSWPEVLKTLKASSSYKADFNAIYAEGITEGNIKDAIATFEKSLYTPNSRFDQYLRGNDTILTEAEKEGYQIFKDNGCVSCHQGVGVGGNMFQKFGLFGDYFEDRGDITEQDLGRYNVTKQEADRYAFKVPSLRNVVLTAPYFHDGSAETLDEAVKTMIKYQLGRPENQEDVDKIVQFLNTLTAEVAGEQS